MIGRRWFFYTGKLTQIPAPLSTQTLLPSRAPRSWIPLIETLSLRFIDIASKEFRCLDDGIAAGVVDCNTAGAEPDSITG